jgi:hypothetical protein
MFGTANRRKAEHYGLWVYLCLEHHEQGFEAPHTNRDTDLYLKRIAQREFEKRHTHELWMSEFGKSYL